MNRRWCELMLIGLLSATFMATSLGCSSSSCGPRMTFREWIQNRPRPLRDLFTRGDECSDCNAPAGQMQFGDLNCPDGNCLSGTMHGGNPYYPADLPPAAANRVGYPPATSEIGSGIRSLNSNAELEIPPMYGRSN